ncbi:unnamed protein product [Paramecium sonneborni]|uniref:Uncharacterized protein n=1 Tax=Paramecium sonneborni TaxID=65129 RepID=A0A8S1MA59_9CILI|nr:unnamed protein product [Paramecium sonneborni]
MILLIICSFLHMRIPHKVQSLRSQLIKKKSEVFRRWIRSIPFFNVYDFSKLILQTSKCYSQSFRKFYQIQKLLCNFQMFPEFKAIIIIVLKI